LKVVILNILITTLAIACSPRVTESLETANKVSYKWGYEYYPTKSESDSLNMSFISPGLETDKNCFPSDFIDNNSISIFKISVFSKWGEIQFETSDMDSNWICNEDTNEDFVPGVYLYMFQYKLLGDPSDSIRKAQGIIHIIEEI
jgi:hypothetical protein